MNIKVLIVEDDPMVAKFNRHYLEQMKGFEYVGCAASGDEAVKMLMHQEVDLILLDIYMPHTSGLQLLSSIREQGSKTDIIVISAASDNATIRKALQNGAVDYLIKPFEFARFQAALKAYQQEFYLMHTENLSQEQLDKLLRYSLGAEEEPSPTPLTIPKGLAESTLENIWNTIIQLESPLFSTEDISTRIPISRISIRKYLAFLTDAGILEMELSYGSIGRPVYKYSVTPAAYLNINKYI